MREKDRIMKYCPHARIPRQERVFMSLNSEWKSSGSPVRVQIMKASHATKILSTVRRRGKED